MAQLEFFKDEAGRIFCVSLERNGVIALHQLNLDGTGSVTSKRVFRVQQMRVTNHQLLKADNIAIQANGAGYAPTAATEKERSAVGTELVSKKGLKGLGIPYSFAHIARLEAANQFPKRVQLGKCRVAWKTSEVMAWIEDRVKTSRGQTK